MSLFGGESGNCPHCGVFVRFQQQQGFASSDNAGNRLATVLTTICPNCQGVVVFIIRDEGDWDRFPQAQPQATEAVIAAGTPYSAYVLVRKLAEEAKKRIWVADPYLDRSIFALLSNTPGGLERRLLTRRPNLHRDFMTELGHFQREFGAVEVRDGLDDQHDRYIVVDDRAFLSGASIKDLGKKESVIVKNRQPEKRSHLESGFALGQRRAYLRDSYKCVWTRLECEGGPCWRRAHDLLIVH